MLSGNQIAQLRRLNAGLTVHELHEPIFAVYGRIIAENGTLAGYQELRDTILGACADTPAHTAYLASIQEGEKLEAARYIQDVVFGEKGIQTGCCWGKNFNLNGMEYHKSSEAIIALTDIALFLGRVEDIGKDGWDTSQAKLFLVPEGTALELYQTTLHFAPVSIRSNPFYAVIILPQGTNLPIGSCRIDNEHVHDGDNQYLFMENKWLLAHPDSPTAKRGARIGITGDNLSVIPL